MSTASQTLENSWVFNHLSCHPSQSSVLSHSNFYSNFPHHFIIDLFMPTLPLGLTQDQLGRLNKFS